MKGLNSLDTTKTTFKMYEKDDFDIEIQEVIAVQKTPKIENVM